MPFHWFWIFWMLVFVGGTFLLVLLAVTFTRGGPGPTQQTVPPSGPPPPPPGSPSEAPLDILARRFAKGEITAEEYQKARDLLSGGGTPP